MSEYWVSQAKYYCKYCNAWMADNKPSRTNHEFSAKHKLNVELFNKKKKEDNSQASREDQEVKKQLEIIERLAKDAVQEDKKEYANLYQPSSSSSPSRSLLSSSSSPSSFKPTNNTLSAPRVEEIKDKSKDNCLYAVRDEYFLEGKKNEAFLKTGLTCQLYVESLDDWYDAVITNRKSSLGQHTNLVLVLVDVQYIVSKSHNNSSSSNQEDGAEPRLVSEFDVRSDRIRIYSNENGEVLHIDGSTVTVEGQSKKDRQKVVEDNSAAVYNAPIDENTGFSSWTTVSVRVINEKDVLKQQKALEQRQRKESEMNKALILKKEGDSHSQSMFSSGNDDPADALNEFNPNGPNNYRGVSMGADFLHTGDMKIAPEGVIVGFKKRKAPANSSAIRDRDAHAPCDLDARRDVSSRPKVSTKNESKISIERYNEIETFNQDSSAVKTVAATTKVFMSIKKPISNKKNGEIDLDD